MSGYGNYIGTNYQASLLVIVYVHIIAKIPLKWYSKTEGPPTHVQAETGGLGDDIAIQTTGTPSVYEVQAKSGLTAGAALEGCIKSILSKRNQPNQQQVVVVTNSDRSRKSLADFKVDLERINSGRCDSLSRTTQNLLDSLDIVPEQLAGISLAIVDSASATDKDQLNLLYLLQTIIAHHDKVQNVYDALLRDANDICAKRLCRDRDHLVALVQSAGTRLNDSHDEIQTRLQIKNIEDLTDNWQLEAASEIAVPLEAQIDVMEVNAELKCNFFRALARLALRTDNLERAERAIKQALIRNRNDSESIAVNSMIFLRKGEVEHAAAEARRSISIDHNNQRGWCALRKISGETEAGGRSIPASVRDCAMYIETEVVLASYNKDWNMALDKATQLLRRNSRSKVGLAYSAICLLNTVTRKDTTSLHDVLHLATTALEEIGRSQNPLIPTLYGVCAEVYRRLEDFSKAIDEIDKGLRIRPDDDDLLVCKILILQDSGELDQAVSLLQRPIETLSLRLRILKAQLTVKSAPDDVKSLLKDLLETLNTDGSQIDSTVLSAVDLAIELKEYTLAESFLNLVTASDEDAMRYVELSKARIAGGRGRVEDARRFYAAFFRMKGSSDVIAEMIDVVGADRISEEELLSILNLNYSPDTDEYRHLLLDYYFHIHDYQKVAKLLEDFDDLGEEPEWVVRARLHISLIQQDNSLAVAYALQLHERLPADLNIVLQGINLLDHVRDLERARSLVEKALEFHDRMTVEQTALIVRVLLECREYERAFDAAYECYDKNRHSLLANQVFIEAGLSQGRMCRVVARVDVGCVVTTEDTNHRRVAYRIVNTIGDARMQPIEISVDEARSRGLYGKCVDERLSEPFDILAPPPPVVVEIIDEREYALRSAIEGFADRFADEQFIKPVVLGKTGSLRDFDEIIVALLEGYSDRQALVNYYAAGAIPVMFLVERFSKLPIDVIEGLAQSEVTFNQIFAAPRAGVIIDRPAIFQSDIPYVLTVSSLVTLARCSMLYELIRRTGLKICCPSSVVYAASKWLEEAHKDFVNGTKVMVVGASGVPAIIENEPNAPVLLERLEKYRRLAEIASECRHVAIPLASVSRAKRREEWVKGMLTSLDQSALDTAAGGEYILYVDDAALRVLATADDQVLSQSSFGLLKVLLQAKCLSEEEYVDGNIELLRSGYSYVPAHHLVILRALELKSVDPSLLDRAFQSLVYGVETMNESLMVALELIRSVSMRLIQTTSVYEVTLRIFKIIALTGDVAEYSSSLLREIKKQMPLQHDVYDSVKKAFEALNDRGLSEFVNS